jgi:hypothetical protein
MTNKEKLQKLVDGFFTTMIFVMRNEVLFTNDVTPKCLALLSKPGNEYDTCLGMRPIYEETIDNPIKSLEEGKTKFLEDEHINKMIGLFKEGVENDGHGMMALFIVDVYQMEDEYYVFAKHETLVEGIRDSKIMVHKLSAHESIVDKDGEVQIKRRKFTQDFATSI